MTSELGGALESKVCYKLHKYLAVKILGCCKTFTDEEMTWI